jgi:hypothetical protein
MAAKYDFPSVADVEEWPADASPLGVVSGRLGSITLYELRDPVAVLIVASGAISLRMIRREVSLVAEFAERHPDGWCYLGDVRGVRFLNPANLVVLQRVRRLPGVQHRVIVVPRFARWLEPVAIGELTTLPIDAVRRC